MWYIAGVKRWCKWFIGWQKARPELKPKERKIKGDTVASLNIPNLKIKQITLRGARKKLFVMHMRQAIILSRLTTTMTMKKETLQWSFISIITDCYVNWASNGLRIGSQLKRRKKGINRNVILLCLHFLIFLWKKLESYLRNFSSIINRNITPTKFCLSKPITEKRRPI